MSKFNIIENFKVIARGFETEGQAVEWLSHYEGGQVQIVPSKEYRESRDWLERMIANKYQEELERVLRRY